MKSKSHVVFFFVLSALSVLVLGQAVKPSLWGERPSPKQFYGIQENQPILEPQLDKLEIRRQAALRKDSSETFLTVPKDYPLVLDFEVAKTAPAIEFAIVQGLEPWYLEVGPSILTSPLAASDGFAIWSGFGDVTRGPDGCFYFAIGNHAYYGGNTFMIKYDPRAKKQSVAFEAAKVCGWSANDWTDGKIHGDPDIDADGDMWVTTFSGPRPLRNELDTTNYKGGHVLHYNVFTGKAEDLGVPLEGDTWSYSSYDGTRGILFAIGQAKNSLMIFDTKTRRMLYGGFPPDGLVWWRRCSMLDPDTGKIYSVDSAPEGKGTLRLISWERRNHTFSVLNLTTPPNPATGKPSPLRAHTRAKDADGYFWCFDDTGTFFKFHPQKQTIELVGVNWGQEGEYTSNMSLSPKGRYVYYLPGSHSQAFRFGTPVVQYDTKTGRKKVLAFLNDFYLDKYGYSPYGSYGLELDEKGESIVFYTNGLFSTREAGSGYGRPALFQLHIPASEREE